MQNVKVVLQFERRVSVVGNPANHCTVAIWNLPWGEMISKVRVTDVEDKSVNQRRAAAIVGGGVDELDPCIVHDVRSHLEGYPVGGRA